MDKDQLLEYTPEGFEKATNAMVFLPEEQRMAMMAALVSGIASL